ncbi:hypothetical protein Syun_028083 [Stephania yunnanensis]|uniref:Uncharacterized protein n=1 Tax=Stephania yunnanensis TaxID=152371 RepID=A0AAP0EK26_9MAGN
MHELHTFGVTSKFVTDEAWNRYRKYWARPDFKARSEKASHNRKNEKGDPGTVPSKYTDGTRSFRTYEDILTLDKDEDDEVTPNDAFLHVHTKYHDWVIFIDRRSVQSHVSLEANSVEKCNVCNMFKLEGMSIHQTFDMLISTLHFKLLSQLDKQSHLPLTTTDSCTVTISNSYSIPSLIVAFVFVIDSDSYDVLYFGIFFVV